jgi:hypothetical protein
MGRRGDAHVSPERVTSDQVNWETDGCTAPGCSRRVELLADVIDGAGGIPLCCACADAYLDRDEALAFLRDAGLPADTVPLPPVWEPRWTPPRTPTPRPSPADLRPDADQLTIPERILVNAGKPIPRDHDPDWDIPF